MRYRALKTTYAYGWVTGNHYRLHDGKEIEAPPEEFTHLLGDTIVPVAGIVEKGGGHYEVVVEGEVIDTVQGKDAAEALLEKHVSDESG